MLCRRRNIAQLEKQLSKGNMRLDLFFNVLIGFCYLESALVIRFRVKGVAELIVAQTYIVQPFHSVRYFSYCFRYLLRPLESRKSPLEIPKFVIRPGIISLRF